MRCGCATLPIAMLNFGDSKAVDFLPDDDGRAWVADGLRDLWQRLGEPAQVPRVLSQPDHKVGSLDDLFEPASQRRGASR